MQQVVVIGGGVAGLATALRLAPLPVRLVTAGPLMSDGSTVLAQGGIAAAIGTDDEPRLHARDTLAAAAGLGDAEIARLVTSRAPAAIEWLVRMGVRFDRGADGELALGREAAHGRSRIVHANGDRTGYEVLRALTAAVRGTPSIEVMEGARARALLCDGSGRVVGVEIERASGVGVLPARAVLLATGGVGGLYAHTTNPLGNVGSGLALAARAGAVLRDVEFVQFHPTAIDVGHDPMPLATEALRGEGARLVDEAGDDVMAGIDGGALAPRDVVASAIHARTSRGQRVYLELPAPLMPHLAEKFPGLVALSGSVGLDLATRQVPVRPAAHYHMGGVWADVTGRTSVDGLWACGEVASTGLHGANRLASNSLLEALVFAETIAADIGGIESSGAAKPVAVPQMVAGAVVPGLRDLMDRHVGVLRDGDGLQHVVRKLGTAVLRGAANDAALVGLMIAVAALDRRESRGSHRRVDYPHRHDAVSQTLTLDDVLARTRDVVETAAAE